MASKQKLWFRAKLYGWGWYPSSWQGWVVTALYAAVIIGYSARAEQLPIEFGIIPIIATVFLLLVCYKTGEPPRWRWGK